jgi:CheY-like chemotaxis protein
MQAILHLPQNLTFQPLTERTVAKLIKNEQPPELQEFISTESSCTHHLRVLLVEDDVIIQKVHRILLEKIGCVVDIASNGKQALEFYQPGRYEIVFLDGGLPDTTGFDLAKIIRSQEVINQHQTLIMLSAFGYEEVKAKCETVGIDAFSIKPVSMEVLQVLLEQWLPKKY